MTITCEWIHHRNSPQTAILSSNCGPRFSNKHVYSKQNKCHSHTFIYNKNKTKSQETPDIGMENTHLYNEHTASSSHSLHLCSGKLAELLPPISRTASFLKEIVTFHKANPTNSKQSILFGTSTSLQEKYLKYLHLNACVKRHTHPLITKTSLDSYSQS